MRYDQSAIGPCSVLSGSPRIFDRKGLLRRSPVWFWMEIGIRDCPYRLNDRFAGNGRPPSRQGRSASYRRSGQSGPTPIVKSFGCRRRTKISGETNPQPPRGEAYGDLTIWLCEDGPLRRCPGGPGSAARELPRSIGVESSILLPGLLRSRLLQHNRVGKQTFGPAAREVSRWTRSRRFGKAITAETSAITGTGSFRLGPEPHTTAIWPVCSAKAASSHSGGRVNWNMAPRGSFAVAHNRPPCASMMERQMVRPMPMPLGLVV